MSGEIKTDMSEHFEADGSPRVPWVSGASELAEARGSVCPIANAVALQVLARAERGMKKYGVNAARQDLSLSEWLQHLQEELLDAAVYVERLKMENTPNR